MRPRRVRSSYLPYSIPFHYDFNVSLPAAGATVVAYERFNERTLIKAPQTLELDGFVGASYSTAGTAIQNTKALHPNISWSVASIVVGRLASVEAFTVVPYVAPKVQMSRRCADPEQPRHRHRRD